MIAQRLYLSHEEYEHLRSIRGERGFGDIQNVLLNEPDFAAAFVEVLGADIAERCKEVSTCVNVRSNPPSERLTRFEVDTEAILVAQRPLTEKDVKRAHELAEEHGWED